jgi:peroxiredoxin
MKLTAALSACLAIATVCGETLPRPMPELHVFQAGKPMNLLQYKGKVVVFEFLSTVCPTCQDCAKILTRVQGDYAAKGVQVVGVAVNPGANPADFVGRFGVTFPVGTASEDVVREFLQVSVMNRLLVPHIVFVDRKGTIQVHRGGAEDEAFFQNKEKNIRDALDTLLAPKK